MRHGDRPGGKDLHRKPGITQLPHPASEDLLLAVLTAPSEAQFSLSMLSAIPFPRLRRAILQQRRRHGEALEVRPCSAPDTALYRVRATRGSYLISAALGADGLITGLRFAPAPVRLARVLALLPFLGVLILLRALDGAWTAPDRWHWAQAALFTLLVALLQRWVAVWPQVHRLLGPLTLLVLAAAVGSALRLPALAVGAAPTPGSALLLLLIFGVLLRNVLLALLGRRAPPGTLALGPMLDGQHLPDLAGFWVAQGGSTALVNYHVAHPHMRYAADFIGVNRSGRHARGLMPADPARYALFGAAVLAPLDGVVTMVRDGRPDLPVPQTDALRPAGNFIQLCADTPTGEVHVLLAHLRCGSVRVQVGDAVRAGQPLAEVGNSGNTSEPHLHLGVSRDALPGQPLSGVGVPFTVSGRFPVRGRFYDRGPSAGLPGGTP